MKKLRIVILILLALGITACTTTKTNSSGKQSLKSDYQNIVNNNIIKTANAKHIAKNGGADGNAIINKRLKNIVARLVQKNGLRQKTIKSILLKSKSVNAYSLGSQSRFAYVYVTRGLVDFAQNDHQLASVLAHEIAHIQLGHHIARQKNSGSGFNQAQELAADKFSVNLLRKAGYDTNQIIVLLRRLDILQANQKFTNQQDYPSNKARIKKLLPII